VNIPQMQPYLGLEEQAAAAAAIADGWISEGPRAAALSKQLNALIGAPYGVFAPNGTLALYLALLAAGIGPGDEVIVPDTTFIASANAVVFAGARPVFVDVEAETFQIDLDACAAAITPRTRAIMPVHLFGFAAAMPALMELAQAYGLLVIEDAAQAIGVRYAGQHCGSFGDLGCFSFFADKTLTMGEGGYVVCRDEQLYERLQLLRNQGRIVRGSFQHPALGMNFRITDIQAAIGLVQLEKLDQISRRKRAILARYAQQLAGIAEVRLLCAPTYVEAVPFRAVILAQDTPALTHYLSEQGVQPRAFFYPLHRQPCFVERGFGEDDHSFPNANYGAAHGMLLPAFPELSDNAIDSICATIRRFYCESGSV
jgi:perosamine synthetase